MKNSTYWSDLGHKQVWEALVKVLNTVLPESLELQEAEIADNAAFFLKNAMDYAGYLYNFTQ